jgi:hypothetical protein
MSLVLRLKTGDAALQAAPLAGETTPGVLPPPEPALLDWASLTPPADDSHLTPCPQCGLPNGLSASSCWNCEADLLPHESLRRRRAPRPAVLASVRVPADAPAHADESLPVLTSAVQGNDRMVDLLMAAVPAPVPAPAAGGRRRMWKIGAAILVMAVVAVGAFLYFEAPAPAPAVAVKSGGFVDTLEPAPLVTARPAPTAPPANVGAGSVPPAVAEARTAATQPAAIAALKVTPVGRPRSTSRTPNVATAPALPTPERSEPSWQAPPPVRAACTPTVAALGLCAAPPTQSKE